MSVDHHRRSLLKALLSASTLAIVATPALSQKISAEQGRLRVNLAGRQRMLTQRMAKAVAFIRAGTFPEKMGEQLMKARQLFDETLDGFMTGEGSTGIERERAVGVRFALEEVIDEWALVSGDVDAIAASGTVTDAQLDNVMAREGTLLSLSNKAVKMLEEIYGDTSMSMSMATAIDFTGRQRMLTQKMSKELALIQIAYKPEENRELLAATVTLFNDTLMTLKDFAENFGIAPPPTPEAAAKLAEIAAIWQEQQPLVETVVAGGMLDATQMQQYLERSEMLLVESNAAVTLYQNA